MADNMGPGDASKRSARKTAAIVKRQWSKMDLEILQSGLCADAEIVCKDNVSRKVHRAILESRSTWFKRALDDAVTEDGICKIEIDETAWTVDLMLRFFYAGSIDMNDKALTGGDDEMMLSVKLIRAGKDIQEWDLFDYGLRLLETYLSQLVACIRDSNTTSQDHEALFNDDSSFLPSFCSAVCDAFDANQPVMIAQSLLTNFAFEARVHLFKSHKFISLTHAVPRFGTMMLTALMTGDFVWATPEGGIRQKDSAI